MEEGGATRSEASGKKRALFGSHNSARSQMAEGLLRSIAGESFEAMSAGTESTEVRPAAIAVMEEVGVDISGQESKTLERYLGEPFDFVVTVRDDANEVCPVFPGAKEYLHWSLPDPSRADGADVFRVVRDRLKSHIEGALANGKGG